MGSGKRRHGRRLQRGKGGAPFLKWLLFLVNTNCSGIYPEIDLKTTAEQFGKVRAMKMGDTTAFPDIDPISFGENSFWMSGLGCYREWITERNHRVERNYSATD